MVQLDAQLLADARRLISGANIHRLKEMIFAYEQAVDLYNRRCPRHEIYRMQSEARLRIYVWHRQQDEIKRRTRAAIERANRASNESIALTDSYDRLEEGLEEWTGTVSGKSRHVA